MRKFSALAFVAVLMFSLVGCKGDGSVAVVDTARLFQESDSGKAGLAHLQNMENAMQQQLMSAQALLEKSPSDEALRAHFQKEFAGYQELVQSEQQKVVEAINAQISNALEKARKKGKFAVVIPTEGVMAFDPKDDITQKVLTSMNEKPVSFAPVVLKPLSPAAPDSPKAESPKTDAPKTDTPATDAPKTDAPKTDTPAADAPKTDAPKADAPKIDDPKTD